MDCADAYLMSPDQVLGWTLTPGGDEEMTIRKFIETCGSYAMKTVQTPCHEIFNFDIETTKRIKVLLAVLVLLL
jgi:hypothetical protein